jgi:TetR/AcrR family transcriptional repressor of nem operon
MGRTSDAGERLIDAMAELVHARGYVDVSVDDVCRAAGVRKGSFYYFFPSKRELTLAALDRHWQKAGGFFGAAFSADVPPLERIARLFSMAAEASLRAKAAKGQMSGCPFGNIAAETSSTEPALARRADEAFCGIAAMVRDALAEARVRGELPTHTDIDEAADALVAYFEGVVLLAKTRNEPDLIRTLGRHAIQLAIGQP